MSQSLLLRGARQLLTLRGNPSVRRGPLSGSLAVIEDGSVFIQGGKIVAVGSTRRLENLKEVRGALEIPAHNCIVMPGLVDPAIHLSLLRHIGSGKPGTKRRKLSEFYNDGILLMRSCLVHGTLNVAIKACAGVGSTNADLSLLRQLRRIGNSPVGMTRIWCPESTDELEDTLEMVCKHRLADCLALKAEIGNVPPGIIRSLDWSGGTNEQLQSLLDGASPISVFCRHTLSIEERAALAASKSISVFQVGGALLDAQTRGNIRDLIDEGGAVALGSGYDALYEPNFNMQLVLALAVRRLNLTIEEAIVASTINAAYAMNRGHQIGSLEPGKHADVLLLNLNDYREIPRRLGVNHVAMAIRDGNIVINRTKWKVGAA